MVSTGGWVVGGAVVGGVVWAVVGVVVDGVVGAVWLVGAVSLVGGWLTAVSLLGGAVVGAAVLDGAGVVGAVDDGAVVVDGAGAAASVDGTAEVAGPVDGTVWLVEVDADGGSATPAPSVAADRPARAEPVMANPWGWAAVPGVGSDTWIDSVAPSAMTTVSAANQAAPAAAAVCFACLAGWLRLGMSPSHRVDAGPHRRTRNPSGSAAPADQQGRDSPDWARRGPGIGGGPV